MKYFSSREVARMLGIKPSKLSRAVWDERIKPPTKAPGGAFLWDEDDVERASWVLRKRSAEDVLNPFTNTDMKYSE